MSVRNEIKAQIVRAGFTMQEVVDLLHDEYGWSDSVSNLSAKLQRESFLYNEVVELADVLDWAGRVIEQAEYLAPRYAVVVANPPYMGSGNMDDKLAELAKAKYPAAKSDLMTMFIERAMTLSINAGTAAL